MKSSRDKYSVSGFENCLGRLAAGCPGWWQWLGNRETSFYAEELRGRRIDRPVYITGLARSGTTLILECLAAQGQTATHRYRDYPFLHTPVWWNRFLDRAGSEDNRAVERFHGDRILITSQSPEAMEEILWMSFFPDCHAPEISHVFEAGHNYPAFEEFYRDHIRKILFLREGVRYVSKANYHITRLGYLRRLLPGARFIIMVRSPVSHIASLWRQHRHFCDREKNDPRILNYMRRTGHFEFGLDRRPVNTGNPETVNRVRQLWEAGREVPGLILLWRSVYQYLADLLANDGELRAAVLPVSYEGLCRFPEKTLKRIYDHCELAVSPQAIADQAAQISEPDYYACPWSEEEAGRIDMETREVYDRMLSLAV
ncbi:MAG: sulfotransferase family protein [Desulfosudaceae bacterium]